MKIPLFVIKEIEEKMGVDITTRETLPKDIGTLLSTMYITDSSSGKLDGWIEDNFMDLLLDLNQNDYSFEKEDLYYVKFQGCYFINGNNNYNWGNDVDFAVKMELDEAVKTLKQHGGDAITKV